MYSSFIVFTGFIAYHIPGALLFFAMVWLLMRGKGAQKVQVSIWWLVFGVFATAIASAVVRYMSGYILGGKGVLDLQGNALTFFGAIVPILAAIGASAFIRTKAKTNR